MNDRLNPMPWEDDLLLSMPSPVWDYLRSRLPERTDRRMIVRSTTRGDDWMRRFVEAHSGA